MKTHPRLRPDSTRLALATIAGLSIALAGCGGESETSAAIEKATISLQALGPGGGQAVSIAYRQQVYNDILGTLRPFADSGTKSQSASANILIAQAQIGLAQLPATEAAELEAQSLHLVRRARNGLAQWLRHHSLAAAAAQFDPKPEYTEIDSGAASMVKEIEAARQEKAKVDASIAALRTQAKAKADEAAAIRQQEGQIRERIPNVSATEALELLRQASDLRRRSDALEVERSNLEAEADNIAPQAEEMQLNVDTLTRRLDLLRTARQEVQERDTIAKEHATKARADAEASAAEIAGIMQELAALRADQIPPKTEEAAKAFESAASAASKARQEAKSTAAVTLGQAKQGLGDVHWTAAQGLRAYADLLVALSKALPALPDSSRYSEALAATNETLQAAKDAATEAYSAAFSAYESAGGRGDQTQLESIRKYLDAALNEASDGKVRLEPGEAAEPTEEPAPDESEPTDESTAAGPQASPKALIETMLAATKERRFEDLADLYDAPPELAGPLRQMMGVSSKFFALEEACKAKFGQGVMEIFRQMSPNGGGAMDLNRFMTMTAADFSIAEAGDTATATAPGLPQPLNMKNVDGLWYFDLAAMGVDAATLGQAAQMSAAMGPAIDAVIADINSGKITDVQGVIPALMGGGG